MREKATSWAEIIILGIYGLDEGLNRFNSYSNITLVKKNIPLNFIKILHKLTYKPINNIN